MRTDEGYHMTREDIDAFLEKKMQQGITPATIVRYRNALGRLYQSLPEDKQIHVGTLVKCQESMLEEGFSASTVNTMLSVSNSLLDYVGHREYQASRYPEPEDIPQPELTRNEYLRLLSTAKVLERERLYMIVKTLGCTGLRVQDLDLVTVDAVRTGKVITVAGSKKRVVRLPACLCSELLSYAARNGILSGQVFVTSKGVPLNRSYVAGEIRRLGEAAHLPDGKATARALRKLWQQTRATVEANMDLLVEQAIERQLEQENLTTGWDT